MIFAELSIGDKFTVIDLRAPWYFFGVVWERVPENLESAYNATGNGKYDYVWVNTKYLVKRED